jgi:hypothetical protein
MMKKKKYYWQLFLILVLASCSYEFPEEDLFSEHLGDISVEKVIAFGDDYLAGVMDGALYSEGQNNSIAAITLSQLSKIEEIQFLQPEIETANGLNLYTSFENEIFGKWIYKYQNKMDINPEIVFTIGEQIQNYSGDKNLLNDVTAPLLKVNDLVNPQFDNNPFLSRVFNGENTNLIDQVVQHSPSFAICWIGMNDFLSYAITGATESEKLTSTETFQSNLDLFIEEFIQKTNGKMVIGNLISIKDLPFFYTKQYNFIRLPGAQKGAAQARYSNFNNAVAKHNVGLPREQTRPFISFEDNGATPYPQPVVVLDENLPEAFYPDGTPLEKYRQLKEGEMALFSITPEMVTNGFGSIFPLTQEYYLTHSQIELIEERLNVFNQIISTSAQMHSDRIVIANVKNAASKIAETARKDAWGIPEVNEIVYIDGVPLEGTLDINSIFSLDGVHLNQRGNAYLSNVFIETLNIEFNANISMTKINDYIGNVYVF